VEVEFGSASWSPRGAVAGDLPGGRATQAPPVRPASAPRPGPRRLPGPVRVSSPARPASAPRPGPRQLPRPAPAARAPPQPRALGRYRLRDDSPTRGLVHGTAPFAAVVLEHGPNSVFTRTGALAPGRRGTVAVSPAGHDRGLCAGRCAAGRLLPTGGLGELGRRRGRRGAVRVLPER